MNAAALKKMALRAKAAGVRLGTLESETKNKALRAMSEAVLKNQALILKANAKDLAAASKMKLSSAMTGRLRLDEKKIAGIASALKSIADLKDPVGQSIAEWSRSNGLMIRKVRVPIGVILIIFESRPNVTADCMALCLKSGNSVILKGGSEAFHSNKALFSVLSQAAYKAGVPTGAFEFVATTERSAVKTLLQMNEDINLVIPRGGEGLIRSVAAESKIPVIKHYKGVCHVFVDKDADLLKAEKIVLNAKTQNPGVCNAMETLLVHEAVAPRFLPEMALRLKEKNVELRGDDKTRRYAPSVKKATEKDWYEEYLDLVLAIRVVKNFDEAVAHIRKYGSAHSDAIVTENASTAEAFTHQIDSACVFVNASTRFNDGGEFGMGAEMGISTDKLHARGPMGLEELTSYKYIVLGQGQVRG